MASQHRDVLDENDSAILNSILDGLEPLHAVDPSTKPVVFLLGDSRPPDAARSSPAVAGASLPLKRPREDPVDRSDENISPGLACGAAGRSADLTPAGSQQRLARAAAGSAAASSAASNLTPLQAMLRRPVTPAQSRTFDDVVLATAAPRSGHAGVRAEPGPGQPSRAPGGLLGDVPALFVRTPVPALLAGFHGFGGTAGHAVAGTSFIGAGGSASALRGAAGSPEMPGWPTPQGMPRSPFTTRTPRPQVKGVAATSPVGLRAVILGSETSVAPDLHAQPPALSAPAAAAAPSAAASAMNDDAAGLRGEDEGDDAAAAIGAEAEAEGDGEADAAAGTGTAPQLTVEQARGLVAMMERFVALGEHFQGRQEIACCAGAERISSTLLH